MKLIVSGIIVFSNEQRGEGGRGVNRGYARSVIVSTISSKLAFAQSSRRAISTGAGRVHIPVAAQLFLNSSKLLFS